MANLTETIKAAIKASDETPAAIARGAGIHKASLCRLLSGERGLDVASIEAVADYLNLEIVVRPKAVSKRR